MYDIPNPHTPTNSVRLKIKNPYSTLGVPKWTMTEIPQRTWSLCVSCPESPTAVTLIRMFSYVIKMDTRVFLMEEKTISPHFLAARHGVS